MLGQGAPKLVGVLAGFGAGAMISAVAFDLVPEAQENIAVWETVLWMLIGVAVFLLGDRLVDKKFGTAGAGGAMGIVVGSVVDGVPESLIFGIQIGTGAVISGLPRRGVRLQYPAGDRTVRRSVRQRLEPEKARNALAHGRARLWSGGRARLPRDQRASRRVRRPGGGARCRRAAGHAHELTDAVRVRAGKSLAGAATVVGFCLTMLNT